MTMTTIKMTTMGMQTDMKTTVMKMGMTKIRK